MGFFTRLSKLQFGKIGKSLKKTLSQGKLVRGTGIDDVINGAVTSVVGADKLKMAAGFIPNLGGAGGKPKPLAPTGGIGKSTATPQADSNNTILYIIAAAAAVLVYFKFIKK